jgi:hypothetical protein
MIICANLRGEGDISAAQFMMKRNKPFGFTMTDHRYAYSLRTNIELHPKSEPVTTQQSFAPELFNAYTYTSYFYIYYILIV